MKTALTPARFRTLILNWFDQHGRKLLPWQINKTPYRVWLSEIMLQQTQVNTVIPYFLRFLQQFPDLRSLASAHEDAVLHLWAGLGYYSRARNLHRAAQWLTQHSAGEFPDEIDKLIAIPGIGPSTAGAISALAFNKRATILDGNVKRVLARLHGIRTPINEKKTEKALWDIAENYTPNKRIADYTQAMMDLGATCCTRANPTCTTCPLKQHCVAYDLGIVNKLPAKKATKTLPIKQATFVILKKGEAVLLQKRPSSGIWGGLWSLPEIVGKPNKKKVRAFCLDQFQLSIADFKSLSSFRHTFTHYHLDIFPVLVTLQTKLPKKVDDQLQIWYNPEHPEPIGLPKPIQTIMRQFYDPAHPLRKIKQRSRGARTTSPTGRTR